MDNPKKVWDKGDQSCCGGSPTCANNKTKKVVDYYADLFAKDSDTARAELYETIANLEEESDMQSYHLKKLNEERLEMQSLFDLQHTRSKEAEALWCKAHGIEVGTIIPDLGNLLAWLMSEKFKPSAGGDCHES